MNECRELLCGQGDRNFKDRAFNDNNSNKRSSKYTVAKDEEDKS